MYYFLRCWVVVLLCLIANVSYAGAIKSDWRHVAETLKLPYQISKSSINSSDGMTVIDRFNAQTASSIIGPNSLIESIAIDPMSGAIILRIRNDETAHASLRGMVITLTPQYSDPVTAVLTEFDLTNPIDLLHQVTDWHCDIDNSANGTHTLGSVSVLSFGRAINVINMTQGQGDNPLFQYCADVDVNAGGAEE